MDVRPAVQAAMIVLPAVDVRPAVPLQAFVNVRSAMAVPLHVSVQRDEDVRPAKEP